MMKRHNTVKVVLVTILLLMLFTWILPAAYYSGGYVDQGRVQMGLFDLFAYPTTVLSYFGYIALFVLVIGGFYGILNKTGAYRKVLDSLVKKFKGKEKIVISVIMVLLAVITSVCGLQLGLLIFFPFLIALVLMMGYDKIVAALTTVASVMIGIAGTTYAYGNTSIIVSTLSLDIQSQLLFKIIILVLGLALLIFFTMKYISKNPIKKVDATKVATKEEKVVKTKKTTKSSKATKTKSTTRAAKVEEEKVVVKDKKNNILDDFVPEETKGKHNVWPLVVILVIMFILMIIAFIAWSGAFNLTIFDDITTAVTEFEIFGFPLFGKLLGSVKAFGSWSLTELTTMMLIASGLLMIIYKIKFNDGLQAFIKGAKRFLEPAVIIVLVYTCLVISTYHPFQLVIYKTLLGLAKGFNVFTTGMVAILASLLNVEPAYAFQSVLPYLASSIKNSYSIIGVMFQSLYGVIMIVAPTSAVLMVVLSYLGISYKEWLKNIWKLLLALIVLLFVIFTIMVLI